MFTKTLIFVLLGTTLVLANPLNENSIAEQVERDWISNVQDWVHQPGGSFKEFIEFVKKIFFEALNELQQAGGTVIGISKGRWAELKKEYNELKQQAHKALEEQRKIWEARLKEWKHNSQGAIDAGKKKFLELKEQAKKALKEEQLKWEGKFREWIQKVKDAIRAAKEKLTHKQE